MAAAAPSVYITTEHRRGDDGVVASAIGKVYNTTKWLEESMLRNCIDYNILCRILCAKQKELLEVVWSSAASSTGLSIPSDVASPAAISLLKDLIPKLTTVQLKLMYIEFNKFNASTSGTVAYMTYKQYELI